MLSFWHSRGQCDRTSCHQPRRGFRALPACWYREWLALPYNSQLAASGHDRNVLQDVRGSFCPSTISVPSVTTFAQRKTFLIISYDAGRCTRAKTPIDMPLDFAFTCLEACPSKIPTYQKKYRFHVTPPALRHSPGSSELSPD